MMEHENERMNYSFESMDNSNGSEGYLSLIHISEPTIP